MDAALLFTPAQIEQIIAHLVEHLPEEACGLVGGSGVRAALILPVENILHSPVRFRMAPVDQLKAFEKLEAAGLELMAIFHSHPNGPPHPSHTDLVEFFYPGTLVLVASRATVKSNLEMGVFYRKWWIRGFQIEQNDFLEVKLGLLSES